MSEISWMVTQLTTGAKTLKITPEEYDQFVHEYVWAKLQEQRFGQFFCNKFGITDPQLYYYSSREFAENWIRENYLG